MPFSPYMPFSHIDAGPELFPGRHHVKTQPCIHAAHNAATMPPSPHSISPPSPSTRLPVPITTCYNSSARTQPPARTAFQPTQDRPQPPTVTKYWLRFCTRHLAQLIQISRYNLKKCQIKQSDVKIPRDTLIISVCHHHLHRERRLSASPVQNRSCTRTSPDLHFTISRSHLEQLMYCPEHSSEEICQGYVTSE